MAFFSTGTTATPEDRTRYDQLVQVVTLSLDNFRKIGRALKEIRDKELHKLDHITWAECCQQKWKITTQHAARLIDAHTIAELIEPMGSTIQNERQVRPLRGLEPAQQIEAWHEAQKEGGTHEAIERAAAKRKPRKRRPKTLRPTRLRVPGAWVTITPNKKFTTTVAALEHALQMVRVEEERQRQAA